MYRVSYLFGRNSVDDDWTYLHPVLIDGQEPSDIKAANKEWKFVRWEMERKDSAKTYVWEYERGNEVCVRSPKRGDKPCAASPFNRSPNRKGGIPKDVRSLHARVEKVLNGSSLEDAEDVASSILGHVMAIHVFVRNDGEEWFKSVMETISKKADKFAQEHSAELAVTRAFSKNQ